MGIALGDEAEDRADEYLDWCDALETELSGLDDVETVFIQDWDETAVTTVFGFDGETVIYEIPDGAAVIRAGTDWDRIFLEYAEEYASITDRSSTPAKPYYGSVHWSASSSYCTSDGSLCLISALYGSGYATTSLLGSYELLTGSYSLTAGSSRANTSLAFKLLFGLGEDSFPGIIVSNAAVAEKLQDSTLWKTTTYSTQYSSWNGSNILGFSTHVPCFLVEDSSFSLSSLGQSLYSCITGEYDVYVNPTGGIGNWMNGSAESVLEAVWAAAMLSGYDKESMYKTIQDFYSTFYGLELTTDEIDTYVLAGA